MALERIISSGQAGVGRAALDAAIHNMVYDWGGWVQRGKLAEDGQIPDEYFNTTSVSRGLKECDSSRPARRTALNIADSDATMVLRFSGGGRVLSPGTKLTIKICRDKGKPYRIFDPSKVKSVPRAVQWICDQKILDGDKERGIKILNIAGPRESKSPGIYDRSLLYLKDVLGFVFTYNRWGVKIWSPHKPRKKVGL